jgi:hypothetical protein
MSSQLRNEFAEEMCHPARPNLAPIELQLSPATEVYVVEQSLRASSGVGDANTFVRTAVVLISVVRERSFMVGMNGAQGAQRNDWRRVERTDGTVRTCSWCYGSLLKDLGVHTPARKAQADERIR